MASNLNLVVVTGFGPYRNYLVNSSWEAVKELSKLGLGDEVHLEILELPVKYTEVEKRIKRIWAELQPKVILKYNLRHLYDGLTYVCEYAYYMSLYYGNGRALFIHVPQLTKTLTAEKLGQALHKIIQEVLRQLEL